MPSTTNPKEKQPLVGIFFTIINKAAVPLRLESSIPLHSFSALKRNKQFEDIKQAAIVDLIAPGEKKLFFLSYLTHKPLSLKAEGGCDGGDVVIHCKRFLFFCKKACSIIQGQLIVQAHQLAAMKFKLLNDAEETMYVEGDSLEKIFYPQSRPAM